VTPWQAVGADVASFTSPAMASVPEVVWPPTVMGVKLLYGMVGAVRLVVGQLPLLDVVTDAAVTDVRVTLSEFVFLTVKYTVPEPPGTRLGVAVAALSVTLTVVPTVP